MTVHIVTWIIVECQAYELGPPSQLVAGTADDVKVKSLAGVVAPKTVYNDR